jgi:hypothetical protein
VDPVGKLSEQGIRFPKLEFNSFKIFENEFRRGLAVLAQQFMELMDRMVKLDVTVVIVKLT